jgi:molybdate transport system regulatory protein
MKGRGKAVRPAGRRKSVAEKGPLSRVSLRLRVVFTDGRQIGPG